MSQENKVTNIWELVTRSSVLINPLDIYSEAVLKKPLPPLFEHTFNVSYPQIGDYYLDVNGGVEVSTEDYPNQVKNLRLILKRRKDFKVTFVPDPSKKQPEFGDYYSFVIGPGEIYYWNQTTPRSKGAPVIVYKRVDEVE